MGKYILIIGNNCPACPEVEAVLRDMKIDFEIKNADKEQEYYKFLLAYGLHSEYGIPVPQLFYIDDDGTVTYLYSPSGEDRELMKHIISDRINKMKKQHLVGKNFLIEDLEEIAVIVEKGKMEKILKSWLERAKKMGVVGRIHVNGKEFIVDLERLGKLVENKFNCLCFKGLKCPCPRFLKTDICSCGVFFAMKKEK